MDFSFGQIFDRLNTPESYTILVIILVAFLFGFIIGMLLRGARAGRLRNELESLKPRLEAREREVADLQDQLATANEELTEKDKIFELQRRELEEAEERVLRLEQEKNKLYNEVQDVNAELEQLQASNRSYLSTIEDLNDQLLGIKARREQQPEAPQPTETAGEKHSTPEAEAPLQNRLQRLETKMNQLERENLSLRQEMNSLRGQKEGAGAENRVASATVSSNTESELPAGKKPSGQAPSNLQIVEGIDAQTEAHLKASGIESWEDLADSTTTRLRSLLRSNPELPQKDPQTWPIQARLALNGDWDLLEEYQQQLLDGYEVGPED